MKMLIFTFRQRQTAEKRSTQTSLQLQLQMQRESLKFFMQNFSAQMSEPKFQPSIPFACSPPCFTLLTQCKATGVKIQASCLAFSRSSLETTSRCIWAVPS